MKDELETATLTIPLDPELLGLENRADVADAVAQLAHDAVLDAPGALEDGIQISRDRRICSGCGSGPWPGIVDLWPEVAYWERPRSLRTPGSGSQGVSRHKTGRWLCASCAGKLEHGLPPEQGRLT
jgi:hypothetical protein